MTSKLVAFISARIDEAIAQGHHFALGPSLGIDSEALTYLIPRVGIDRLTVYLHHNQAKTFPSRLRWFESRGGKIVFTGRNHTERDEACTRASHYDILRYRTEAECKALYGSNWRNRVSGTELNERRRATGIGLNWAEDSEKQIEALPEVKIRMHEEQELDKSKRKLERKVKEARMLQIRKDQGEHLEKNQLEKLVKLREMEEELRKLLTMLDRSDTVGSPS
ncbi:hypothetical protein BT96DRAFT_997994 [Gymnopus androsaceus JB14]|uniref:Uncharacterized protein n=1 Tax=Gymnopus androsaceus JB14 TaxID=1447944 RepID=A0A6A4HD50_9AGAR|nr:hypothetical protein BT96DRAFT_997994 [Gymnopus androsaceus JB14]